MLSLKSVVTIFSESHCMLLSHIRNFAHKIVLTKTFVNVPSGSSPILVTPSCVAKDEIYAKKTFEIVRPKTVAENKKRNKHLLHLRYKQMQ